MQKYIKINYIKHKTSASLCSLAVCSGKTFIIIDQTKFEQITADTMFYPFLQDSWHPFTCHLHSFIIFLISIFPPKKKSVKLAIKGHNCCAKVIFFIFYDSHKLSKYIYCVNIIIIMKVHTVTTSLSEKLLPKKSNIDAKKRFSWISFVYHTRRKTHLLASFKYLTSWLCVKTSEALLI